MSDTWMAQPHTSQIMSVKPEWIDYNGHLNMAYYNVLFDTAIDEVFLLLGLGPDYVKARNASFFTAETHLCYVRELSIQDEVTVTFQLLDYDSKRAHIYQELHHATEGWLSATSELMSLHVDMAARRVAPWPDDIGQNLAKLHGYHQKLPKPERAGRTIGIKR